MRYVSVSVRISFWWQFSRHVAVSIALNLSSFIYPPLVLDITNLSLDVGTHSMVFSFPGVTMTVGLPICESLTFASYQSFDQFAPKRRKQQTSRRKLDVGKHKDLETSNQLTVEWQLTENNWKPLATNWKPLN